MDGFYLVTSALESLENGVIILFVACLVELKLLWSSTTPL